jgi:hypothetical protein
MSLVAHTSVPCITVNNYVAVELQDYTLIQKELIHHINITKSILATLYFQEVNLYFACLSSCCHTH